MFRCNAKTVGGVPPFGFAAPLRVFNDQDLLLFDCARTAAVHGTTFSRSLRPNWFALAEELSPTSSVYLAHSRFTFGEQQCIVTSCGLERD